MIVSSSFQRAIRKFVPVMIFLSNFVVDIMKSFFSVDKTSYSPQLEALIVYIA